MPAAAAAFEVPPHSLKIEVIDRVKHVVVRVYLKSYRIPVKFITYTPTEDRFVMGTTGNNKKLQLDIPYPEGIKVIVPEDPEATLEYGVLTARLAIVGGALKPKLPRPAKVAQVPIVVPKVKSRAAIEAKLARKPKKPFAAKSTEMAIIEQISAAQEKEIEDKLAADTVKMEQMELKKDEIEKKRARRSELKAKALAKIKKRKSEDDDDEKPSKKRRASKI